MILPSATLLDAAHVIASNGARTVIVVQDYETCKVIGTLSEGDILRALLGGADVRSPLADFATMHCFSLQKDDKKEALRLFVAHGFDLIPIINERSELQSVITILDCLKTLSL